MQNKDTALAASQTPELRPTRERVGLVMYGTDAAAVVAAIIAAEAAGVRQVWMTQFTSAPDTMAIFAAAAVQTTSVRMEQPLCPPIRAILCPLRSRP